QYSLFHCMWGSGQYYRTRSYGLSDKNRIYILYFTSPISFRTRGLANRAIMPAAPMNMATLENRAWESSFSNWPDNRPANRLPRAAPTNQIPIICPSRFLGASFVMDERPTGDRQSSPQVCRKYVTMSQAGEARLSGPVLAAPQLITKNPADRPRRPNANLSGMEGLTFRAARAVQSHPNRGASRIMKMGLTDCSQLAGTSQSPTMRLVL